METKIDLVDLMYDFQYTLPGTKKEEAIFLYAGDRFEMIEEKNENWWLVKRLDSREEFYIPSAYCERSVVTLKSSNQIIPPRPPIKPKNLKEKLEMGRIIEPPTPPFLSSDIQIQLFTLLTKSPRPNKKTKLIKKHSSKNKLKGNKMPILNSSYQENQVSEKDNSEQLIFETHSLEKEKRIPQPPKGSLPIKVFNNGYQMFEDQITTQYYFYNPITMESSWILPKQTNSLSKKFPLHSSLESLFDNALQINKNSKKDEMKNVNLYINNNNDNNDEKKIKENNDKIITTGYLNKSVLTEEGKKLKKNKSPSYLLLEENNLYFFKDHKSSLNKSKAELLLDLRECHVVKGRTGNKENLIQLIGSNGVNVFLQSEDQDLISSWFQSLQPLSAKYQIHFNDTNFNQILSKSVNDLSSLSKITSTFSSFFSTSPPSYATSSSSPPGPSFFSSPPFSSSSSSLHSIHKNLSVSSSFINNKNNSSKTNLSTSFNTINKNNINNNTEENNNNIEKSTLVEKLKLWLVRRPSQDLLREKGILKEEIFGNLLILICEREDSKVPDLVEKCLKAVEQRGLTTDGIYRVSGNLSDVQKLRMSIESNQQIDFLSSKLDIHVITGILKLFFRELREPLIPFSSYHPLLHSLDKENKREELKSLVENFPDPHYQTLKSLILHLKLISTFSSQNRMSPNSLSIIFGPTLLWPEQPLENEKLTFNMIRSGQAVECLINESHFIFEK